MKTKINPTLTLGFAIIPFFSNIFQAIIEQNILVLCSIYLGILTFLIIELFISAFEIGSELLLYIIPTLFTILIPIIAVNYPHLALRA